MSDRLKKAMKRAVIGGTLPDSESQQPRDSDIPKTAPEWVKQWEGEYGRPTAPPQPQPPSQPLADPVTTGDDRPSEGPPLPPTGIAAIPEMARAGKRSNEQGDTRGVDEAFDEIIEACDENTCGEV